MSVEAVIERHVLYRFFDADKSLLYVGRSKRMSARFSQHSETKPWWGEVIHIYITDYPDPQSLADAEREAIVSESPLYNVHHNSGSHGGVPASLDEILGDYIENDIFSPRTTPIQVGDWVALACADGRCPVGWVTSVDAAWIVISQTSPYAGREQAIPVVSVERIYFAEPVKVADGYELDATYLYSVADAWEELHTCDALQLLALKAYRHRSQINQLAEALWLEKDEVRRQTLKEQLRQVEEYNWQEQT